MPFWSEITWTEPFALSFTLLISFLKPDATAWWRSSCEVVRVARTSEEDGCSDFTVNPVVCRVHCGTVVESIWKQRDGGGDQHRGGALRLHRGLGSSWVMRLGLSSVMLIQ